MNKLLKKICMVAVSAMLVFSCTACGGNNGNNTKVDGTKTQLMVKYYGSGYGSDWINNYIKVFEEKYKDFKNGDKVGVQVQTNPAMTKYSSVEALQSDACAVYFLEGDDFSSFAKKGAFEDLTSIVTSANDDGKTIESKLSAEQKEYFSVNGKYYGLPHYTGSYGLIYNKDLFEKNNLYIKENATPADFFVSSKTDKKSAGPDGKTGIENGIDYSADDGLPATYEEFFMLCDELVSNSKKLGIKKPIVFNGAYKDRYVTEFMANLAANYNGVAEQNNMLSYDGKATKLVKMAGDVIDMSAGDIQLEESDITRTNGYELARQAGVYYGSNFLEKLLTNGNSNDPTYIPAVSVGGVFTHKQAQKTFINGDYAMLIDGTWWMTEASASISESDKMSKQFGWMPLPHATSEQVGDKQVYVDAMFSSAAVRSGLDAASKELALNFVKGFYTDENLVEFTKTTSTLIGVDYNKALEAAKSQLTPYALSLNNYIQSADVYYSVSNNDFYNLHYSEFLTVNYYKIGNMDPASYMLNKNAPKTAKQYFEALYSNTKKKTSIWG